VLRAFTYDPSLAAEFENFDVSEVQIRGSWEPDRLWADVKKSGCMKEEPMSSAPFHGALLRTASLPSFTASRSFFVLPQQFFRFSISHKIKE
jgi:hypothetical protein